MAVAIHRHGGSHQRSSIRLEQLEDRLLPSIVFLDAPPAPPDAPAPPDQVREHHTPDLPGDPEQGKDSLPALGAAADKPPADGYPQLPATIQQPAWTPPDGAGMPANPAGGSPGTPDPALPASGSSGDSTGDAPPPAAAPLRATDAVLVGDVQGQSDFQSRLDNFTSPPETQLVASPQPLEGGSLAVVATLLTGAQAPPGEKEMLAPTVGTPEITAVLARQAPGKQDVRPFLAGVAEGLEHSLVVERQRLANATQPAVPGLAQPVVVNSPPMPLMPQDQARPALPLDPRQARADMPAKEAFCQALPLPAPAEEVVPDPVPLLSFVPPAEEQLVCTPVEGPLLPPAGALPELGAANEEPSALRPTPGLLVAAVFTAGFSCYWWAENFAGTGSIRLRSRSRLRREDRDRR